MPDTEWPPVQVPHRYDPGEIVFSNTARGRVAMVADRTFTVVWDDGDGYAVVYPIETEAVRKRLPWES
jgi:hypothetical protein